MRVPSSHPFRRSAAAIALLALAVPLCAQNHGPAQTRTVEQAPPAAASPSPSAGSSFQGAGPSGSPSMGHQRREGGEGGNGHQRREGGEGGNGHQRHTTTSDRPRNLPPPTTQQILKPQATPRLVDMPENRYWRSRDLFAEIRVMARRGFIAVTQIPETVANLEDFSWFPSGWRAYGFAVPPKEHLKVRLHHPNEGWFRLVMVNKWGQTGAGMLQNLIPTGNPEVTYNNPTDGPQAVYVIVDDPGWMSSKEKPFTLDIKRSWDPAVKAVPPVPAVLGIWAQPIAAAPAPSATPEAAPKPLP